MRRLGLAAIVITVFGVLAGAPARVNAGTLQTFDLEWSGASFGNGATAVGTITMDMSLVFNPGHTQQNSGQFVSAFSITITGASTGNGTFGFNDFNGASFSGGFLFDTEGGTLDFTNQLVGQPTPSGIWGISRGNFLLFSNHSDLNTPTGVDGTPLVITTSNGSGDSLMLTSFAPVASVPEPSSIVLASAGVLAGLGVWSKKRRS